jgi:hypothetical protein
MSMSGKGNCYDAAAVLRQENSPLECFLILLTFFKTIKAALIWRWTRETRRQAETSIFQYINGFYNPRRRHSAWDGIVRSHLNGNWLKRALGAARIGDKTTMMMGFVSRLRPTDRSVGGAATPAEDFVIRVASPKFGTFQLTLTLGFRI